MGVIPLEPPMSELYTTLGLLDRFTSNFRHELASAELLGREPWTGLLIEIEEINGQLQSEELASMIEGPSIRSMSPIDMLALGENVVCLTEGGMTPDQVAGFLTTKAGSLIETAEVERWLKDYKDSTVAGRSALLDRDIFSTKHQMQALLEGIKTKLAELEAKSEASFRRNSKDEVFLSYMTELRMLVKDAYALQKAEQTNKQNQLFQEIALGVIREMCPEAGLRIFKELKSRSIALGLLS